MNAVRNFLLAVQFFTRIPVTGALADWVGFNPAMLRASAAHFPGVGWLVGGLTAAMFFLAIQVLPPLPAAPWVAVVVSSVFSVMLTGAFHEDGLADLADGLGGSADRERALDIMKDSRIGSYGAMALLLALSTKISLLVLLAQCGVEVTVAALFAGHVFSRLMPLFIVRALPHVGDTARSKSKPLADQISTPSLLAALLWTLPALALAAWLAPGAWWLAGVLGALSALAWMWQLLRRRLGGFTGDALGATQQVSEIFFYLGLLFAIPASLT